MPRSIETWRLEAFYGSAIACGPPWRYARIVSLLKRAERIAGKFQNPVPTDMGGLGMMLKLLPQLLTNREERKPKTPLGPFSTDASIYSTPPASGLRVT